MNSIWALRLPRERVTKQRTKQTFVDGQSDTKLNLDESAFFSVSNTHVFAKTNNDEQKQIITLKPSFHVSI